MTHSGRSTLSSRTVSAVGPGSRRRIAVGAVVAPFSQALGSFLLHMQVSQLLGNEGLAEFAVLFGVIVLGTALVSGSIGDSLTVLDRNDPAVRAGLQFWLLVVSTTISVVAAGALWVSDFIGLRDAALFGLAGFVFMVQDSVRRMLMAVMRFWSIVIVDLTSMAFSVTFVVAVHVSRVEVTISTFLIALVVGQLAGGLVALLLLPMAERTWTRGWASGHRDERKRVWQYGRWRGLQQAVRPLMMTLVRVIAIAGVGRAAFGELEGARLFVAPAMLAVNGACTHLFASFARDRDATTPELLRRSDKGVAVLVLASVGIGGGAVASLPWLSPLVVGDDFDLRRLDVVGWASYAAAVAATTPYGMLVAVRGAQKVALMVRSADATASVIGVAVVMRVGWSATTIPYVLVVFALLGGLAIRHLATQAPECLS